MYYIIFAQLITAYWYHHFIIKVPEEMCRDFCEWKLFIKVKSENLVELKKTWVIE